MAQAREFRRYAQKNAADNARKVMTREAKWMARQPQGRQAKSQSRVQRFYELTSKAGNVPQKDLVVDFGSTKMSRQGAVPRECRSTTY